MTVSCPGMTRVDSYRSNAYQNGWTSVVNLLHGQKRDRYRTDSIPPQISLRQNSLINSKVGQCSIQGMHAWVPFPHTSLLKLGFISQACQPNTYTMAQWTPTSMNCSLLLLQAIDSFRLPKKP